MLSPYQQQIETNTSDSQFSASGYPGEVEGKNISPDIKKGWWWLPLTIEDCHHRPYWRKNETFNSQKLQVPKLATLERSHVYNSRSLASIGLDNSLDAWALAIIRLCPNIRLIRNSVQDASSNTNVWTENFCFLWNNGIVLFFFTAQVLATLIFGIIAALVIDRGQRTFGLCLKTTRISAIPVVFLSCCPVCLTHLSSAILP